MVSEPQVETTLEEYSPWLTPKRKLIAGGIVLAVAFTAIIYVVTVNTGQFFLEVSEVHERADTLIGKDIQVRGTIVNESLTYGEDRTVTFDVLSIRTILPSSLYRCSFRACRRGSLAFPRWSW